MTANRFEGGHPIRSASADKLLVAFNTAGIVFVADGAASPGGGPGVRLASPDS